jgi:molybdopterin/thiamine biosynthesis adenylyltransferase
MITKEDFQRYSRQIFIDEVGMEGHQKIKEAKVLVIGAGGLGSPVLQYLAGAGVGTIGIADFDTVALHNLHRQVIHHELSIGASKVQSAVAYLKSLNNTIEYIPFGEKLTTANAESIIAGFDIVADGSDNFETRYLVNDTCVRMGKTLVYGSILNFEGQIAVFNHNGSKNLRDIFPEPPDPADVPNCGMNGVLGSLTGIVGSVMAHEVLKAIAGLKVLRDELLIFNTLDWNLVKLEF